MHSPLAPITDCSLPTPAGAIDGLVIGELGQADVSGAKILVSLDEFAIIAKPIKRAEITQRLDALCVTNATPQVRK